MIRLLIFFFCTVLTLFAEESYSQILQQKARELKLDQSREWHLLLHYKPALWGGVESLVDDETFFIADDGKTDPQHELQATIDSFFQTSYENNSSLRTRCIFVERYHWLKETLQIDETQLPAADCSRYAWWEKTVNGSHIALIFPAAYMNNPSSMFGHSFLRIDKTKEADTLLSYALNYAATTGNDNGVSFAVKGIFGGYPGYFSVLPYFEKIREYNDLEDRDIYEYRLRLNVAEVRRLVRHAWELHFFSSDYFFFKENCSYNILLLLEYARPSLNLSDGFFLWAIPSDTIRVVYDAGLVDSVIYRPSKSTTLKHLIAQSSTRSQELALDIADKRLSVAEATAKDLPKKEMQDTLEIAYEYVDYLRLANEYPHDNAQKLLLSILMKRSRYGIRETPLSPVPKPDKNPHEGHSTSRLSIGAGGEDGESALVMKVKPSYHDIVDDQGGYIDGAEINFFDLELLYLLEDRRLEPRRLNVFNIKSIATQSLFFKPVSWEVTVGMKRTPESEEAIGFLEGGSGIAVGERVKTYLMTVGSFENSDLFKDHSILGAGLAMGVLGNLTHTWRIHAGAEYRRFFYNELFDRRIAKLEQNIALGDERAVRINLSSTKEYDTRYETFSVLYQIYF